jgi:hypothetical protein
MLLNRDFLLTSVILSMLCVVFGNFAISTSSYSSNVAVSWISQTTVLVGSGSGILRSTNEGQSFLVVKPMNWYASFLGLHSRTIAGLTYSVGVDS